MAVEYISYSAWKDWNFCPFKHKITRIDRIKAFTGNIYSAFGTSMHDTAEEILLLELEKDKNDGHLKDDSFDPIKFFKNSFKEELNSLDSVGKQHIVDKQIDPLEIEKQGIELIPLILPEMKKYFGNFRVVQAEQEVRQTVDGFPNFDFHGYIDLIIQTEDGKYHIIDWKSTSWGWDLRKRSDIEITYQLTYYKYFFCKATGAQHKDVETHFCLLKRTAVKDKIEFFRVTSGDKKISNALNVLNNCVTNIIKSNETGKYVKNKLNCERCEFHRTIHCP